MNKAPLGMYIETRLTELRCRELEELLKRFGKEGSTVRVECERAELLRKLSDKVCAAVSAGEVSQLIIDGDDMAAILWTCILIDGDNVQFGVVEKGGK